MKRGARGGRIDGDKEPNARDKPVLRGTLRNAIGTVKRLRATRQIGLGTVVFLSSAIFVLTGEWGESGNVGSDTAHYLYQAYRSVEGGGMVWRGYFSSNPLGHPGPILHWILMSGVIGARILGADWVLGGIVAYVLAICGCYAVAASMIKTGSRSLVAGVAAAGVAAWLAGRNAPGAGGVMGVVGGLSYYPIFGPSLAAALAMAGVATGYAVINGAKRWAWVAVLFGGLMIQISLESAPVGAMVLAAGVWTAIIKPGKRALGLGALIVGCGPFLVRMYLEGWDLPYRYVTETIGTRDRDLVSQEPIDFLVKIHVALGSHDVWGTTSHQTRLLILMVAGVGLGILVRATRRGALFVGSCLGVELALVAWFLYRSHQAATVSSYLPLSIAIGVGAIIHAGRSWVRRSDGRWGWVVNKIVHIVATSIAVWGVGIYVGGLDKYQESKKPQSIYPEATWMNPLVKELQTLTEGKHGILIGLITRKNAVEFHPTVGFTPAAELYSALAQGGLERTCVQGEVSPFLVYPGTCQGQEPAIWVIIDTEQRPGVEYVATRARNPEAGEYEDLYIKILDNRNGEALREDGFVYCEFGSVKVWVDREKPGAQVVNPRPADGDGVPTNCDLEAVKFIGPARFD